MFVSLTALSFYDDKGDYVKHTAYRILNKPNITISFFFTRLSYSTADLTYSSSNPQRLLKEQDVSRAAEVLGFCYLVIFLRGGVFHVWMPTCDCEGQHRTLKQKRHEYNTSNLLHDRPYSKRFSLSPTHPKFFPATGLCPSQEQQGILTRAPFLAKVGAELPRWEGHEWECLHSLPPINPAKTVSRPLRTLT